MTDLDQKVRELRALAEKATPGEWRVAEDNNPFADGRHVFATGLDGSDFVVLNLKTDHTFVTATSREQQQANARFSAAVNPATLTAILDEYDRRGAALVEAEGARPKYERGDVIRRDGQWLRFIEEELEGEKWEIIGPVSTSQEVGK